MKTLNGILILLALSLNSCSERQELPILGETSTDPVTGELSYYKAPEFDLINQQDQAFTDEMVEEQIKVVDFFFTSCPTICPQMTNHLKLVQDAFDGNDEVAIISFSIDAKNDTPERLFRYAEAYGINNDQWAMLTGDQSTILDLAKDYKVRAFDDSNSESMNLIHDGTFVLIDDQQRIRGYYNGLERSDTERLIKDIKQLLGT